MTDRCKPVYPPLFQSGGITSKFGEFISPAKEALVCLKFILSFINFVHLLLSYGLFVDFKSRAINHGLLILYEHWHVITIQNC